MEIRSRQDLVEYLPDDAPWASYPLHTLRLQSAIRSLDPSGYERDFVTRLEGYRNSHPGENRLLAWRIRQDQIYKRELGHALSRKYYVVEVEDNSNDTSMEKLFTLLDASSDSKFYVIISRIPRCSCPFRVSSSRPFPHPKP